MPRRTAQKLQPHEPEAEALALAGTSAEAAAWDVCHAPVGLADVEALLAARQPELFREYAAAKARAAAAAAAEAAASKGGARAARCGGAAPAAQQGRVGPHLTFSSTRLVMTGVEGDSGASAALTVTGTGSAAVYFTWTRHGGGSTADGSERDDESSQQEPRPAAAAAAGPASSPARFYQPQRTGVILPGEARSFVFSFRSSAAGVFSEDWALTTTPPLPSLWLRHRAGAPVVVTLRGVAVPRDLGATEVARLQLEADLARCERDRQVRG